MTNGDYIRNKLTDEYIVENCFCIFWEDCPDCPLAKIKDCKNYDLRMEWLKKENTNEFELY